MGHEDTNDPPGDVYVHNGRIRAVPPMPAATAPAPPSGGGAINVPRAAFLRTGLGAKRSIVSAGADS